MVERYACPSWRLAAVTSTSRLASASPTRAAFERLGPSGRPSHVLAGQASARGADLPREPCRFVCEPVRAGCPGPLLAVRRTRPPARRRDCTYGRARLLSAAHIGGERTSACGWSVSLSLLAVPCPSALLRSCSHSHPQNAHRCRSRSCVPSRTASVGVAIDCRAKMSPADNTVGRAAVQAPPHGVGALVPRRELFDVLGRARRVVQVSAPAGSGKTSLLRSWIAEAELRDSVAWVSVAAREGDPERFWLSVLDAVRATKAGSSLVGELTPAPDLDGGAIAERLLADLSPLDEPLWLVIDDLHELCSDDAFRQLELLLMRAPAVLRFVLLSRGELHLGLHRLRLDGELTEIRAADLRFSLDESQALFESAGVQLSESGVALLAERTEGWAAGLRLAALSLTGHHDPERFAAAFAGSERTVAEYLVAEVLDRQPERVRRLLLRTSVLERVSGPLADLLTAGSDGQRVLQELEEAGAFVVSLDLRRSWFRYHPLFAELLQLELRRTAADELPALHRAAATWLSEHGHAVEAIRHAQAAEEWTVACRLLSDNWFGLILSGQRTTAHQLLAGFPLSAVGTGAELSALRAAYELDRGSPERRSVILRSRTQAAESEARTAPGRSSWCSRSSDSRSRVIVAISRPWWSRRIGCSLRPRRTDVTRPGLSDDLRAFALLEFGVAELWTGRFEAAARHLEHALATGRARRATVCCARRCSPIWHRSRSSMPYRGAPSAAGRRSNSLSATGGRTIPSPASRTRSTVSLGRSGTNRRGGIMAAARRAYAPALGLTRWRADALRDARTARSGER